MFSAFRTLSNTRQGVDPTRLPKPLLHPTDDGEWREQRYGRPASVKHSSQMIHIILGAIITHVNEPPHTHIYVYI